MAYCFCFAVKQKRYGNQHQPTKAVRRKDGSKHPGIKRSDKVEPDITGTYNKYKTFEGRQYSGMTIGRSHKWYDDKGEWKEKKISPDNWEFTYAVTKRRAGKAPEGSGAAVGTEYHWYILAHQHVRKLNANDYSTAMTGYKYKVAHKRAEQMECWRKGAAKQTCQTSEANDISIGKGSGAGKEKIGSTDHVLTIIGRPFARFTTLKP